MQFRNVDDSSYDVFCCVYLLFSFSFCTYTYSFYNPPNSVWSLFSFLYLRQLYMFDKTTKSDYAVFKNYDTLHIFFTRIIVIFFFVCSGLSTQIFQRLPEHIGRLLLRILLHWWLWTSFSKGFQSIFFYSPLLLLCKGYWLLFIFSTRRPCSFRLRRSTWWRERVGSSLDIGVR